MKTDDRGFVAKTGERVRQKDRVAGSSVPCAALSVGCRADNGKVFKIDLPVQGAGAGIHCASAKLSRIGSRRSWLPGSTL